MVLILLKTGVSMGKTECWPWWQVSKHTLHHHSQSTGLHFYNPVRLPMLTPNHHNILLTSLLAHPPLHANLFCLFLVSFTCGHAPPHLQLLATFLLHLNPSVSLPYHTDFTAPFESSCTSLPVVLLFLSASPPSSWWLYWVFHVALLQKIYALAHVCCLTLFFFCFFCHYHFESLIIPSGNLFLLKTYVVFMENVYYLD